ncbi:MAG: hypothetical protein ABIA04_14600 [Pseudomonadota bacterium]
MSKLQNLFIIFILSLFCVYNLYSADCKNLVSDLKTSSQEEGIQVGLIIDSHDSTASDYCNIITLPSGGSYTAYDVLLKAKITLLLHPSFDERPKILILSMMGKAPDKTSAGNRSWAFFTASISGSTVTWSLAEMGVDETKISDGALIGFSRTAWRQSQDSFQAIAKPRVN